jgi:hypothetical protein
MGKHPKPVERREARHLRAELGMPIKRIASRLGVSPSSVLYWTKDIKLTPEQRMRNVRGPFGPQSPERIARRVESWKRVCRERRLGSQQEGRRKAAEGDPLSPSRLHALLGGRRQAPQPGLANSDVHMLRFPSPVSCGAHSTSTRIGSASDSTPTPATVLRSARSRTTGFARWISPGALCVSTRSTTYQRRAAEGGRASCRTACAFWSSTRAPQSFNTSMAQSRSTRGSRSRAGWTKPSTS